ncbi:MAG: tRNA 2-thiocytidine(32) synthetase TtcA [Kangiellaceae bacterium]|nr:tRNA 2-thiocytidine(32) synthetase TtcA [Kangiellaceae bacterium]
MTSTEKLPNIAPQQKLAKIERNLRRNVGKAIHDFNMIEDGDKIMVCLSGGKDSYTMLEILRNLQKRAPINFEIVAVNLDQKQPGFPEDVLPSYLESIGIEHHIIEEDTYSIVTDKIPEGKTTCSLCSRLRRGIIYSWANNHQITKIALGHHRDDIIETLFLNMFFGGKLKSMPPKLRSDDGKNTIIRPLAYAKESDIQSYSDLKEFPIIPCNLCGSQENLQRKQIKSMLAGWERQYPGRLKSIFSSLSNVTPSHLMDNSLFPFSTLASNENMDKEELFDAPTFDQSIVFKDLS